MGKIVTEKLVLDKRYEKPLRDRFDGRKLRVTEPDEVWELGEPCCLCEEFRDSRQGGSPCAGCPFTEFVSKEGYAGCVVWLREKGYKHNAILTSSEDKSNLEAHCRKITEIIDEHIEFK